MRTWYLNERINKSGQVKFGFFSYNAGMRTDFLRAGMVARHRENGEQSLGIPVYPNSGSPR